MTRLVAIALLLLLALVSGAEVCNTKTSRRTCRRLSKTNWCRWSSAGCYRNPNVHFVGNSYTYRNKLPTVLNYMMKNRKFNMSSTSTAWGGAYFMEHVDRGTPAKIRKMPNRDVVVLQEQSQFPRYKTYYKSFENAAILAQAASDVNAKVLLMETWGWGDGVKFRGELELDGTYATYQANLFTDYTALTASLGSNAALCPVGQVWQKAYNYLNNPVNNVRKGWKTLYARDGRHPSMTGTYLAAATMYKCITNQSPASITWNPRSVPLWIRAKIFDWVDEIVDGSDLWT